MSATLTGANSTLEIGRFQSAVVRSANCLFHLLSAISRRRLLACLIAAIFPVALRLAVLRQAPIPQPLVHDEFSYLLGAETFASGRLSNPTPKMWVHFETYQEIFQPTYASKYPPGQSMVLAAGIKLFGHPWYGVLLSFGLMSGCLCWMLQGWLPDRYAFLGTLVAIAQIGIFGYWMDSYWGGAVAATGGCLLLGAVPRLAARAAVLPAILGAIGILVIGNTRPFEGVVTTAAATAALLWWRRHNASPLNSLLRPAILIPVLAILAAGSAATGYYNYRVTGSPRLLPYSVHDKEYAVVPALYVLPLRVGSPIYHHDIFRKFYVGNQLADYWRVRHNPLRYAWKLTALDFVFSPLVFVAFAAGVLLRPDIRVRLALVIIGAAWFALAIEVWAVPHYYAPVIGLFFVPVAITLRWLKTKGRLVGSALVLIYLVGAFGSTPYLAREASQNPNTHTPRQSIIAQLQREGGRHLVIVRYDKDHNPEQEFVYNHADIDAADIIWARDMGDEANRELLDYYQNRQFWLLEPDHSLTLQPYHPTR